MRAVIGLVAVAAFAAHAQTPPAAFPVRNVPATFFGRPSGAVTLPQGCTHGTRPCSSSAMILSVIC